MERAEENDRNKKSESGGRGKGIDGGVARSELQQLPFFSSVFSDHESDIELLTMQNILEERTEITHTRRATTYICSSAFEFRKGKTFFSVRISKLAFVTHSFLLPFIFCRSNDQPRVRQMNRLYLEQLNGSGGDTESPESA